MFSDSQRERKNILRLAKQLKMPMMSSETPSDREWYHRMMPRLRGTISRKEPMLISRLRINERVCAPETDIRMVESPMGSSSSWAIIISMIANSR